MQSNNASGRLDRVAESVGRRLTTIHLILGGVGIFGVCQLIGGIVAGILMPKFPVQILRHHEPFFFHDKPAVLASYVMSCAAIVMYFAMVWVYVNRIKPFMAREDLLGRVRRPWQVGMVLLVSGTMNTWWIWWPDSPAAALAWGAFVLLPFVPSVAMVSPQVGRWSRWVIGVGVVEMVLIFLPFVVAAPRFVNEFFDIPETTILKNKQTGEIRQVDNHRYINERNLFGLPKYDPRCDAGGAPEGKGVFRVAIPANTKLLEYIESCTDAFNPAAIGNVLYWAPPSELKPRGNFFYDRGHGELVATGPVHMDEFEVLRGLVESEDQAQLDQWRAEIQRYQLQWQSRYYDKFDQQFIEYNEFEMGRQMESRWVVHHHNFVIGPINEMMLGRPVSEINAQYGILNLYLLKGLISLTGGLSWQAYQSVTFSFYYVYLAMAFVIFYLIVRDLRLLGLFVLLVATEYSTLNYRLLQLSPGQNPIRHLFDLLALWLLYLYLQKPSPGHLLGIWIALVLALLNNTMTGLFLSMAIGLTLAARCLTERRSVFPAIGTFAVVMAVAATMIFLRLGKDYLTPYYLKGLVGFPVSAWAMFLFTATAVGILGVLAMKWTLIEAPRRYLLLALVLYSLALFMYYVWAGQLPHFLNFMMIYGFAILLFLQIILKLLEERGREELAGAIVAFLLPLAVVANVAGAYCYVRSMHTINKVFTTHVAYRWTNPRARVLSTMPEEPFRQSTELIQRYSKSNGIHIISKYDMILPFLAGRYSAMPFPDLHWFIVTMDELEMAANAVKRDRPEYLFVDTDIDRPVQFDLIDPRVPLVGPYQPEAMMRSRRVLMLQKVFDRVRGEYQLLERTPLISVWGRAETMAGEGLDWRRRYDRNIQVPRAVPKITVTER